MPAASPRRKATSGVIGYLLTRPLIPSVPKRRTLINYSKISFVIEQRNRPLIRSDAGKSTRFPDVYKRQELKGAGLIREFRPGRLRGHVAHDDMEGPRFGELPLKSLGALEHVFLMRCV